jgi:SAM-dependent methyltransferase
MNENPNLSGIIKEIDQYYTAKVSEFGATPKGVDWNSSESQEIRFKQLSNIINLEKDFSVLDYGCGFASMYNYLSGRFTDFNYTGYDISAEMIRKAIELNVDNKNFFVIQNEKKLFESSFNFAVASGVFNVRLNNNSELWQQYIESEVEKLNALSSHGFSFNMLTKYSDPEYCKDYLHYADPEFWFARCKSLYSRNVSLLHDYDLYEFTIIVRKK